MFFCVLVVVCRNVFCKPSQYISSKLPRSQQRAQAACDLLQVVAAVGYFATKSRWRPTDFERTTRQEVMITRSGREYKEMAVEYGEPLETHELDSARAAVRSGESAEVGSGMADVVRLLLAQQEGERRRREECDRGQQERWEETQRAEERRRQAAHEL